ASPGSKRSASASWQRRDPSSPRRRGIIAQTLRRGNGVMALREYQNVKVEREDGITFLILNRPEKRNAMSVGLNDDMVDALIELEGDEGTQVLVLTGAGDSFSAGVGLPAQFRRPRPAR